MSAYQVGVVVATVGALWFVKEAVRSLAQTIFPQGLPGEKNTVLLASPRFDTSSPATIKDLGNVVEYDYIIIGTGTAGCVLANRLTEDSSINVLAIEAGHSDVKQLMSRIPAGLTRLFSTSADWAFETTPQSSCANRKLSWPRGKMIGGCSSINAMMYTKGAPDDYNEWERLGNKGWGYKDLLPYINKSEKFYQPADSRRQISTSSETQHGKTGPWQVSYTYQAEINRVFPDACDSVGIRKVDDINTDRGMIGATHVQTFIDKQGQRSSTAVAYLTADVVKRPNLKIASGQTVTRIIFDESGSQPRAVGIEMATSSTTIVRYLVKAKKEILLCGGAVGTPQLLKLSGIGPAKELHQHNIPLVKDLPGVGSNLTDHMAYHGVTFKTAMDVSLHWVLHPIKSLPAVLQWLRSGSGPLTSQACDSFAFVRTADREDAPPTLKDNDRASGSGSADLELMALAVCLADHGKFVAPLTSGYGGISAVCLRPKSKGNVNLASSNPFDHPLIEANVLSDDYDVDLLLYGVKTAIKIAKSKAYEKYFQGWYEGPKHPLNWDTATDEEIKAHIRQASETLYHPMGTAKMGQDADAVVDDQLKVHGVLGLRVVDSSIFPTTLACHTCAPVVMVAEKAADLIKGKRL